MRRKRFAEEQIIGILKQAQAGVKILGLFRLHSISDETFYTWRSKVWRHGSIRCQTTEAS